MFIYAIRTHENVTEVLVVAVPPLKYNCDVVVVPVNLNLIVLPEVRDKIKVLFDGLVTLLVVDTTVLDCDPAYSVLAEFVAIIVTIGAAAPLVLLVSAI